MLSFLFSEAYDRFAREPSSADAAKKLIAFRATLEDRDKLVSQYPPNTDIMPMANLPTAFDARYATSKFPKNRLRDFVSSPGPSTHDFCRSCVYSTRWPGCVHPVLDQGQWFVSFSVTIFPVFIPDPTLLFLLLVDHAGPLEPPRPSAIASASRPTFVHLSPSLPRLRRDLTSFSIV
jgi:hypothetical protein